MRIGLAENKLISEVQEEFSALFPHLRLEFYYLQLTDPELPVRKHLPGFLSLLAAGQRRCSNIDVIPEMTVAEIEKQFRENHGLNVQVCRQAGLVWLETTMTDNWSLKKQNEQGRDLSLVKSLVL